MTWIILLLAGALVLGYLLGLRYRPEWVKSQRLMDWQALLTIAGIAVAGMWFFFERPDAGKIEIGQELRAVPIDDRWMRLFAVITVKNVGNTSLSFEDQPFLLTLSELPVREAAKAGDLLGELGPARAAMEAGENPPMMLPIRQGTAAVPRANFIGGAYHHLTPEAVALTASRSAEGLTINLEAEEKEEMIFSANMLCRDGLVVYSLFQLEKKNTWYDGLANRLRWGKARLAPTPTYKSRQMLDLADACAKLAADREKGAEDAG